MEHLKKKQNKTAQLGFQHRRKIFWQQEHFALKREKGAFEAKEASIQSLDAAQISIKV